AASAVKIGGERAYRLARRGVEVEMPLRRSTVHALDVIAYRDGTVTLDLRVGSGTYVRAIADALGGHCRTLRRTEVGPFSVENADEERILPSAEALPWLPVAEISADEAEAIRGGRRHAAADTRTLLDGELVAVGTFDGVHLGHRRVIETALAAGPAPTVVTFHPHPRRVMGYGVELLTTLERRLELLAELGIEEALVVEFSLEVQRVEPDEFA